MPLLKCPVCKKADARRLYQCRHCKVRVCFACVFVKRCCGVVPEWHRPKKGSSR